MTNPCSNVRNGVNATGIDGTVQKRQPPDKGFNQKPFDPLSTQVVAESVVRQLLTQEPVPLPPEEPFKGAGIYAIYYTGEFEPYAKIAEQNRNGLWNRPVYVGKAEPGGRRKGLTSSDPSSETVLWKRLREHAASINQAENLDIKDFRCRYLVVVDVWIPLAERLLIERFKPIWNGVIDGFGIHDPGSGRKNQKRSDWDTLHPGRNFAKNLPPGNELKIILERLEKFISSEYL